MLCFSRDRGLQIAENMVDNIAGPKEHNSL